MGGDWEATGRRLGRASDRRRQAHLSTAPPHRLLSETESASMGPPVGKGVDGGGRSAEGRGRWWKVSGRSVEGLWKAVEGQWKRQWKAVEGGGRRGKAREGEGRRGKAREGEGTFVRGSLGPPLCSAMPRCSMWKSCGKGEIGSNNMGRDQMQESTTGCTEGWAGDHNAVGNERAIRWHSDGNQIAIRGRYGGETRMAIRHGHLSAGRRQCTISGVRKRLAASQ